MLVYPGLDSAISIEASTGVTIEELALLTLARGNTLTPAIAIHNSSATTLQRNALARVGVFERALATVGLGGVLVGVLIRENLILGAVGIGRFAISRGPTLKRSAKAAAAPVDELPLLTADLVIQDNTLECARSGVSFDAVSIHAFQTRLAGNLIVGCDQAGINMRGWVFPGSGLEVRENEIHTRGAGIVIGTDDARVESNNIAPAQAGEGTDGIVLAPGFDESGLDRCQILANHIIAMPGNGIHIAGAIVRSAMIKNNFIQVVGGGGIVVDDKSSAVQLTIENNQLLNIAPLTNDENTPVVGLRVVNTARAEILTNVIAGVGVAATQNPGRAAIQLANVDSGRVNGNEIVNVGPAADFLNDTIGVECVGSFSLLDISGNIVRRNETPPDKLSTSRWFAVRISTLPDHGFAAVGAKLAFFAEGEMIYVFAGDKLAALPRGREVVSLQGNLLEGYGAAPAIFVDASGALTLSTNRCVVNAARESVADAQAGAIIANSNYLEGSPGVPAMRLQLLPENGPFTVVGNIASGEILINGAPLPVPWAPLNVVAS
jgi:hypothetical protein